MQGRRTERVAHLVQQELGRLLIHKVKDPVIQGTTITDVHVSPDLSVAKVFFPALDGDQARQIRLGLERASTYLRRQLGAKLQLKKMPELRFLRDDAVEQGRRIDQILDEIREETRVLSEEETAAIVSEGKRFLITSHLNPDGDAIGSMLAMLHLLRDNGKEAKAFLPDSVPGPYQFLAGASEVSSELELSEEFDLVIVLDAADRTRIASTLPRGTEKAKMLVIDHHPATVEFGDYVWRWSAAAVGEMVALLARRLGWTISPEFAECAYTALLTDTGSFRYASTSAQSLQLASWLVEHGVEPWKVASNVYESWPVRRLQLLGDVLTTLELECGGRFASLVVSQQALGARQALPEMAEGFVNEGRKVEGVQVSALFRELGDGQYRLSFRSRGRVNVGEVAQNLGGGGHHNASGATVRGDLAEVRRQVRELVDTALADVDGPDETSQGTP